MPKVTGRLLGVWTAKSILGQGMLCYFFYKSWIAIPCLLPVAIVLLYRQWQEWRKQVVLDIESGFKEWLHYVKGGLHAGRSVEQAILHCKDSFADNVGAGQPILLGLEQLYRGLELNIPIEVCIRKLGEETGVGVIEEFSVVFAAARKQGGHMVSTLERTIQQIAERIDLRQEIHAMISAKKMEQRIMCIMPFAILFFVGKASGGYFEPLYHNLQGVLIMTACMVVYIGGVMWGERLTEIRI